MNILDSKRMALKSVEDRRSRAVRDVARVEAEEVAVDTSMRDQGSSGLVEAQDKVDVSASNELRELTQKVMEAPVETPSLSELKAAIKEGVYKPDLERLADKLLADPDALD